MKEYKYSTQLCLESFLAVFVSGSISVVCFFGGLSDEGERHLLGAIFSGVLFCLYSLVFLRKLLWRFRIYEDSIEVRNYFRSKAWLFSSIQGYRKHGDEIEIAAGSQEERLFVHTFFDGSEELLAWLQESYPDLERADSERVSLEIKDTKQRLLRYVSGSVLNSGIRVMLIVSLILSITLIVWVWNWPLPGYLIDLIGMAGPMCILMVHTFGGRYVRFLNAQGQTFEILQVCISVLLILVWAKMSSRLILDEFNLEILALFIAIPLTFYVRCFLSKGVRSVGGSFLAFIVAFLYGYACSVFTNCDLDDHVPETYRVSVLYKDEQDWMSEDIDYNMTLETIGLTKQGKIKIILDEKVSKAINIGDSVTLFVKKGRLGSSWMTYSK